MFVYNSNKFNFQFVGTVVWHIWHMEQLHESLRKGGGRLEVGEEGNNNVWSMLQIIYIYDISNQIYFPFLPYLRIGLVSSRTVTCSNDKSTRNGVNHTNMWQLGE